MAGLSSYLGAITYSRTSILEVIDGTLKSPKYADILTRRLMRNLPNLRNSSPLDLDSDSLIFQHDQASPHGTQKVKEYFEDRSIYVLPWPPKSPDLNLIEAVWARLKDGLNRSYEDSEQLQEDIIFLWENIPSEFIANLYNSMRERIRAVIEAQGGPTDY